MDVDSRSKIGEGRFRSNLEPDQLASAVQCGLYVLSHLPGLLAEYTGLGASSSLVTFLSLPIKPVGQLMPVIDRCERSVH